MKPLLRVVYSEWYGLLKACPYFISAWSTEEEIGFISRKIIAQRSRNQKGPPYRRYAVSPHRRFAATPPAIFNAASPPRDREE
jgi:hypothetical protein